MQRLLHADPACASLVTPRWRFIPDTWTGSSAVTGVGTAIGCERGDSNPHGCPPDPKSGASANSATLAAHTPTPMDIVGTQSGHNYESNEPRRNRTFNLRIK